MLHIIEKKSFSIIFLADSGYAQRNYILIPVAYPDTPGQILYNEVLIRTEITTNRSIGVWKRRFAVSANGLRLKLDTALLRDVVLMTLYY